MMFRLHSNTSKFSLSHYVIMAMVIISISSHVKDKNSIFTARDEGMILLIKGKSWYFTSVYIIKRG